MCVRERVWDRGKWDGWWVWSVWSISCFLHMLSGGDFFRKYSTPLPLSVSDLNLFQPVPNDTLCQMMLRWGRNTAPCECKNTKQDRSVKCFFLTASLTGVLHRDGFATVSLSEVKYALRGVTGVQRAPSSLPFYTRTHTHSAFTFHSLTLTMM